MLGSREDNLDGSIPSELMLPSINAVGKHDRDL